MSLTVIGEGERFEELRATAAALTRLRTEFVPHIPLEHLGGYLEANVDVLFAMGSSALDGASRGIPTFLLDYSYRPIKGNYRFRLLDETEGYNLGSLITGAQLEKTSTLEESLLAVRANYEQVSRRCAAYWEANHSAGAVVSGFERCAARASATLGEMRTLGFFSADPLSRAVLVPWQTLSRPHRVAGFGTL
jgi:hypothetical protein